MKGDHCACERKTLAIIDLLQRRLEPRRWRNRAVLSVDSLRVDRTFRLLLVLWDRRRLCAEHLSGYLRAPVDLPLHLKPWAERPISHPRRESVWAPFAARRGVVVRSPAQARIDA